MAGLFQSGVMPDQVRFGAQNVTSIWFGVQKLWPMDVLSVQYGDFALNANDTSFVRDLILHGESTGFALSLGEVRILLGQILFADTNVTILSSAVVGLLKSSLLTAGTQPFASVGGDANYLRDLVLPAEGIGYDLLGASVVFKSGLVFEVDTVPFSYTGYASGFANDEVLVASTGAYLQTASATGFTRDLMLGATLGQNVLIGQEIALAWHHRIAFTGAAYQTTGYVAGLLDTEYLAASTGVLASTGVQVGLKRNLYLRTTSQAFSLTATSVVFDVGIRMLGDIGVFNASFSDAIIKRDIIEPFTSGAYILSGIQAPLRRDLFMGCVSSSFATTYLSGELLTYDLRATAGDESGSHRALAGDETGNRRRN